jgi:hypothetical protein
MARSYLISPMRTSARSWYVFSLIPLPSSCLLPSLLSVTSLLSPWQSYDCCTLYMQLANTSEQPVAKKIAKALGAKDYNLLQNNGRIAHQEVDHVHFHVVSLTPSFPPPLYNMSPPLLQTTLGLPGYDGRGKNMYERKRQGMELIGTADPQA